jgi:hypothetical protein
MRIWFLRSMMVTACVLMVGIIVVGQGARGPAQAPAQASTQAPAYRAPRTKDGKPDLNGVWQAMNTANWNLEPHGADFGPFWQLGAAFAVPPGAGIVEGGTIPYKPEALQKRKDNFTNRMNLDPEIKCYLPGVPRAMYMPYPFQIIQSTEYIMMVFEFAGALRTVYMKHKDAPADSWMGWSNGKWVGETLVVETSDVNDLSWFDRSGNYHSEMLKVTERFTAIDKDHLNYEATIEDPKVFSRPWKISMPLYRNIEKNAQILEFKCVEFAEDVIYGHLRKVPLVK